ncbi:hypothetical protein [Glaciecola sp. 1036]|uniref:hypothetical protein n=1 Tax=Alteromonadaceae TaxID=72275 RepID=UPI003D002AA4
MIRISFVLLALYLLTGCVTHSVQTSNQNPESSQKIKSMTSAVLIPIKVEVKESGIGSLEKLPEESAEANRIVKSEVIKAFSNINNVDIVEYSVENEDEQLLFDDYVGLYQRVAVSAENIQYMGPAWSDRKSFNYTLGNGLSYLKDKTGSDKAIFIYGEDIVTSGGKKALAALAMIGGIGVNPGGIAVLHIGVVDLDTGHLLWSNSSASQGLSLDSEKSVKSAIAEILSTSPLTTGK